MKKFLMTFAAMLLVSAGAFAQSSETPLKGDVNEDGVVDVADINAVIAIIKNNAQQETTYYFSIGTTPVTAENYTTANNATTTIPSTSQTYWNNSGSKANIYVLVPSDKTITIVDASISSPIDFSEETSVTIPNHKVYKTTARIANGGGVKVTLKTADEPTTYYWYVGHVTNAQFESSSSLNTIVTNNGTSTTSTTGPSTLNMPTGTGDVLVYIYPTVWGTPTITYNTYGTGDMSYEDVGLTPPTGYKVRFWDPGQAEGKSLDITWSNYYFSAGVTPITSSNYTSANNATTTIPSTHEFTNNSGSKALVYVLVPSNKTVTAIDTYARVSINMVIDNTITISNHKVYVTDGKISNGGSLTFTIS